MVKTENTSNLQENKILKTQLPWGLEKEIPPNTSNLAILLLHSPINWVINITDYLLKYSHIEYKYDTNNIVMIIDKDI